jgi:esterase/lipase superfamily enzyme
MVIMAIGLSGCASRPSAAVLNPVQPANLPEKRIVMLTATNRNRLGPGHGFGTTWSQAVAYQSYEMSVPPAHQISAIEYPADRPDPQKQFVVTRRQNLSESEFVTAARSVGSDGSVELYVHGYNNSFQEALYREAQIVADSGLDDPIMFSWPSQASVVGYVADRDAVLYSRRDLQSVVTALASTKKIKRIILFGHSMGGFLVMEVVRQLKLEHREDVISKLQVLLASPDIDVDVFRSQIKEIGKLPVPLTLFVSKVDRALAISSLLGGERPRVGRLDINDPIIQQAAVQNDVRVIDLSSLKATDGVGHDRFASLARFGKQLELLDRTPAASASRVGAFVFDAAGVAVSSPFRLASSVITPK